MGIKKKLKQLKNWRKGNEKKLREFKKKLKKVTRNLKKN